MTRFGDAVVAEGAGPGRRASLGAGYEPFTHFGGGPGVRVMGRRRRARAEAERAAAVPAAAVPPVTPAEDPRAPEWMEALTAALGGELGRLRGEVRARDADLVAALERIADSYDRLADQVADHRRVNALLAEALVRIDRRLAALESGRSGRESLPGPAAPRVIGGSITPPAELRTER
jgi:hypothetical protein